MKLIYNFSPHPLPLKMIINNTSFPFPSSAKRFTLFMIMPSHFYQLSISHMIIRGIILFHPFSYHCIPGKNPSIHLTSLIQLKLNYKLLFILLDNRHNISRWPIWPFVAVEHPYCLHSSNTSNEIFLRYNF